MQVLVLLLVANVASSATSLPLWPMPRSVSVTGTVTAVVVPPSSSAEPFFKLASSNDNSSDHGAIAVPPVIATAFARYTHLVFDGCSKTGGSNNGDGINTPAPSALLQGVALPPTSPLPLQSVSAVAAVRITLFELHLETASLESSPLGVEMDESYTLTISSSGIAVAKANTQWGGLRALETFSQLVAEKTCKLAATLPISVVDEPRFPHRGIMIDSSRHYLPIAAVKSVVQAMEWSKLNVLHWHLTDAQSFPVESTTYPKLASAGSFDISAGCESPYNPMPASPPSGWPPAPPTPPPTKCTYSHADLKEVVEYAHDRGIRVVPEFDMPAHSASWSIGYPVVDIPCDAKGSTYGNVIDPLNEDAFKIIEGFLTEMAAIFPDEQMHLGMDEVQWTCFNKSAAVREYIQAHGLQFDDNGFKVVLRQFVARVQAVVAKLGKSSSVWQEALDKYGPGNHGGPGGAHSWIAVNTELHPGTTVQLWKSSTWYDGTDPAAHGSQVCINVTGVLAQGHRVLTSGPWYLSENYAWPSGYLADPATNETCTYDKVTNNARCQCFEEGNTTNTTSHPGGGGCYNIHDDDPRFKRVLGGEACMWGEHINATNIHRAAWPGGLAVAERLWSAKELNDAAAATPRVQAQMARLAQRGVNTRPLPLPPI